jgi:hypothetical protein
MKILKTIFLILAVLPLLLATVAEIMPNIGLIFLFIENILYIPVSWLGDSLFVFSTNIGGYIPTSLGRILASSFYLCLFLGANFLSARVQSKCS